MSYIVFDIILLLFTLHGESIENNLIMHLRFSCNFDAKKNICDKTIYHRII